MYKQIAFSVNLTGYFNLLVKQEIGTRDFLRCN